MASSIAFFWAEEPSPVRVPLKHSVAALSLAEADELEPSALVVPVELRVGDQVARLLTTIATLGTAQDVTLQELRIETFHPADAATADLARQLASLGG